VLALAFALVQFGIARPLTGVVGELKKLAAGDFNVSLPWAGRKDEIGQIAAAAEMVAERVGATISNIKMSARDVANASAEISTSATDLSQRTEEQAASLEETSASMEEMSSTVKRMRKMLKRLTSWSTTPVRLPTVEERSWPRQSSNGKDRGSSHKISDIIVVIDEIARQTNLLP
jgi:methyl-accepting chemotaxis protein